MPQFLHLQCENGCQYDATASTGSNARDFLKSAKQRATHLQCFAEDFSCEFCQFRRCTSAGAASLYCEAGNSMQRATAKQIASATRTTYMTTVHELIQNLAIMGLIGAPYGLAGMGSLDFVAASIATPQRLGMAGRTVYRPRIAPTLLPEEIGIF